MDSDNPEILDESAAPVDVAELRHLLELLREFQVSGFQLGNMSISFLEPDPYTETKRVGKHENDDGHSTSNRRVAGFNGPPYRDPRLWAHQNGKSIKFDGTLTE